LDIVIIQS